MTEAPSTGSTFDAFISYSHAADDLLAPRLQAGLQRFAKPWWRRRAMRVFRDESSLSANPHLWGSISEALDGAGWFILLLSPDAAASPWVDQEVAYWVEHRDPDRIIPVVTGGEFGWADGDVVGDAVPPSLRGVLSEEPRWVDLRFARDEEQLDLQNPRFADAVADVASTIRGIPKDELASEEVRQHRRTMRTAWAAAAGLAILLVVATVAALVAVGQSNRARREAELAHARELVASATNVTDEDPELGILLFLAAADLVDPTPESVTALHRAVLEHRTLLSLRALVDSRVSGRESAMLSPDGSLIARTADNRVVVVDSATRQPIWSHEWEQSLEVATNFNRGSPILFSADGSKVIVPVIPADPAVAPPGSGEGVYLFEAATGRFEILGVDGPCPAVRLIGRADGTVRLDGPLVVVRPMPTGDRESPCDLGEFQAVLIDDGQMVGAMSVSDPSAVASVGGDGGVLAVAGPDVTGVFDLRTGETVFAAPGGAVASLDEEAGRLISGGSPLSGGAVVEPDLIIWDVGTGESLLTFGHGFGVTHAFFVGDGSTAATAGHDGTVRLWNAVDGDELVVVSGSGGAVLAHSVAAGGKLALGLSDDGVRVWTLGANGESAPVDLPRLRYTGSATALAGRAGVLTVVPPGANSARHQLIHFDLDTGVVEKRIADVAVGLSVAWSPDGRWTAAQILSGGAVGPVRVYANNTGSVVTEMEGMCAWVYAADNRRTGPDCRNLPDMPFVELAWNLDFSPDGTRLALGGFSGSVTVWDTETGAVVWNSGTLMGAPITIAYHPTGDQIGFADLRHIRLVDTTDFGELVSRPTEAFVRFMRFTAAGDLLVTATAVGNLVWYDSVSLEERGRIDGVHEGVILDLEVTDSGSILTAGSDGFVRLWDLEGREIQSIPFDGPVNNIEVIDDAHILVTPLDGPGFVLTIDVDELVELARRRLTRGFSESECLRYRLNPCPTLEELQS